MIKIENTQVVGLEAAIRGMRNPMNSWEKSDSIFANSGDDDVHYLNGEPCICHPSNEYRAYIGPNDRDLMLRLARQGPVHGKYRRMIVVYVDITAPLYWWKQFDTYQVGTVKNSCSTMHKIHAKEFTLEDFSSEYLICWGDVEKEVLVAMKGVLDALNFARNKYLETKDERYWYQMIQLLPNSYNQKRTVMLNYEVLANIYQYRWNHKLDEWREFCVWIDSLPYSDIIACSSYGEDRE